MKVKLIKTWSGKPPGHVFTGMHRGMALTLVKRGFAEVIEDPGPKAVRHKPKEAKPLENIRDDNKETNEAEPDRRAKHPTGKRSGRKKATGNS